MNRDRTLLTLSRTSALPLWLQAPARRQLQLARTFGSSLRPGKPQPVIFGRMGSLVVRLATSRGDIRRAQRLRYQVFYEELSAQSTLAGWVQRLDKDPYDAICEHLIVEDTADLVMGRSGVRRPRVVGTYRALCQDRAERGLGFYSAGEFELAPLISSKRATHRFMELGRSCVLVPYRNKRTIELLWHGLWTYARLRNVDVMIGCASLHGANAEDHTLALSYLNQVALAPADWRVTPHASMRANVELLAPHEIDRKAALKSLPPLIKAYLRVGAWVGEGAAIDKQFDTTDVLMILPVNRIHPRYFAHFGAPDEEISRVAA